MALLFLFFAGIKIHLTVQNKYAILFKTIFNIKIERMQGANYETENGNHLRARRLHTEKR
jgi:hypothetical protein